MAGHRSTSGWSLLFLGLLSCPGLGLFLAKAAPTTPPLKRDHWAFQPINRPLLPQVSIAEWNVNPIDRFIFTRLQQEQLEPSAAADKTVLVRRLYLDLLGLPPTRAEVEAFVSDPQPDAWSRLVDDLLNRPQYGERWGRHWLDVARYADTKGYVDGGETRYPFAYTYRDYVIESFNEDLPYDRFLVEQLAADQLEKRKQGVSLAALGFLTVGHRFNLFPHEVLDDRIDVVGRGIMGLTVACARCHDHKYDPISMEDYYGWYGIFASSREPSPDQWPVIGDPSADPEFTKKLDESAAALHSLVEKLHAQIQQEMRAWAKDYLVYLVQTLEAHRTQAQPPLRSARGLLREATAYGRGGAVRWKDYIAQRGTNDPVFGLWNRLVIMSREEVEARGAEMARQLAMLNAINPVLAAALEQHPPRSLLAFAETCGEVLEETEAQWQEIIKSNPKTARFAEPAREELRQVLYGVGAPPAVSADESEDLYQLKEHVDVRGLYAALERVFLSTNAPARAMVVADRAELYEPHIFLRGNASRLGEPVVRRFLRLFPEVNARPFKRGSGRLELAQALVSPRNPLTARVWVNRVWGWHFGEGLVKTPSDFGLRSDPPSHPELLDYLASWLIDHGWSTKRLHRLILNSRAYQQSTADRPAARQRDPANRFLWRMNRLRLDFETMRDSLLAVTDRLDATAGGPPETRGFDDPDCRRRTVYLNIDREHLPNLLRVFDFPSPDLSSPHRPHTTVPQQTLFLLNSRFVLAQAEALVHRLEAKHLQSVEERVQALHQWIYAREALPDEVGIARDFLQSESSGANTSELLAPWAQYAQALLQSNEFEFVD